MISLSSLLIVLTLLLVKHFVFDFLHQPPYMYLNKGTFLHWGGISHSYYQAITTFIIIIVLALCKVIDIKLEWLFSILLVEFITHYLIDYAKVNINKHYGWTATNGNQFWILLGLDQLLHGLTYVYIIYILFKGN